MATTSRFVRRCVDWIYAVMDDTLCFMSALGYRPVWYKEWWQR